MLCAIENSARRLLPFDETKQKQISLKIFGLLRFAKFNFCIHTKRIAEC